MHPVVIDQIAADRRSRYLAEAEARRRQGAYAARTRRAPAWRALPARVLAGFARRLDPRVEVRPARVR